MKGTVEIELTLGVSDETAAACCVVLNHYLRSHPETEVDILTDQGVGDTLCRKIQLRNREAEP